MTLDLREWLEADGTGGFAMGTASGVRTRRYHALLCTATAPPSGRMVLVNGLEVFVELAGGPRVGLSSQQYPDGVIHPRGGEQLVSFSWNPWPRRDYALGDGSSLVEEIVVPRGGSQVIVRWQRMIPPSVSGLAPARLWVRPLLSGRDYHALHHENPSFRFDAEVQGERVLWQPYASVPAICAVSSGRYEHSPDWYRRFVYAQEAARGLDCEEDLASPGIFHFELGSGPAVLRFSPVLDGAGQVETTSQDQVAGELATEARRRERLGGPLERAADAYLVAGKKGETIIAGYPWFTDWGRDSFIALRGLCLATGRKADAKTILLAWSKTVSQGMVPNRFVEGEGDAPEYNSVDAALWFVIAADALLEIDGSCSSAERAALEATIADIVGHYAAGTRHGIGADEEGFLRCGAPGTQLTWMDARADGREVTPRVGKPVEIQALWANALAIAGRRDPRWGKLLRRLQAAFVARFWNSERQMLFDVIDVDHHAGAVDASFRPNQLFAVGGGLSLALLEGPRARAVVDAAEAALLTDAGLRSLAVGEMGYGGTYLGGSAQRDGVYHQGTVWTWLLGPFVEAWVRVRGGTAAAKAEARERFLPLVAAQLEREGLGHLGEIADGDPPHVGRGCPFQAWSVAEALRLDAIVLV